MKAKLFCMLLCAGALCSCEPDESVEMPVDIPTENPDTDGGSENPGGSDGNNEGTDEKPDKPVKGEEIGIYNIKLNDEIMAIVGSSNWIDICWGNGIYVAVKTVTYGGSESLGCAVSSNGVDWEIVKSSNLFYDIKRICFANGKFVAVGKSTHRYGPTSVSTDGRIWNISNLTDKDVDLNCICYGNGKFVAGSNNSVYLSSDGLNWTEKSLGLGIVYDIIYGKNIFVGTSNNSNIMYFSTDGENWEKIELKNKYRNVCYGNGKFLAVGNTLTVATSSDGKSWDEIVPSVPNDGYIIPTRILYIQGYFISLQQSAKLIYMSKDGINWSGPIKFDKYVNSMCGIFN